MISRAGRLVVEISLLERRPTMICRARRELAPAPRTTADPVRKIKSAPATSLSRRFVLC